ncbi:hypothetical protein N8I77_008224 [Diaporthe amygdali]|uniref:Uncharacterized protein n=1 Tax=Phomopsis amygdali TaxID=1214568 RepID=A0AAD9SEQ1_PHOAM|nr:hypothetical protein N8I77_008224 [Diaporthe amygdali]
MDNQSLTKQQNNVIAAPVIDATALGKNVVLVPVFITVDSQKLNNNQALAEIVQQSINGNTVQLQTNNKLLPTTEGPNQKQGGRSRHSRNQLLHATTPTGRALERKPQGPASVRSATEVSHTTHQNSQNGSQNKANGTRPTTAERCPNPSVTAEDQNKNVTIPEASADAVRSKASPKKGKRVASTNVSEGSKPASMNILAMFLSSSRARSKGSHHKSDGPPSATTSTARDNKDNSVGGGPTPSAVNRSQSQDKTRSIHNHSPPATTTTRQSNTQANRSVPSPETRTTRQSNTQTSHGDSSPAIKSTSQGNTQSRGAPAAGRTAEKGGEPVSKGQEKVTTDEIQKKNLAKFDAALASGHNKQGSPAKVVILPNARDTRHPENNKATCEIDLLLDPESQTMDIRGCVARTAGFMEVDEFGRTISGERKPARRQHQTKLFRDSACSKNRIFKGQHVEVYKMDTDAAITTYEMMVRHVTGSDSGKSISHDDIEAFRKRLAKGGVKPDRIREQCLRNGFAIPEAFIGMRLDDNNGNNNNNMQGGKKLDDKARKDQDEKINGKSIPKAK